MKPEEKARPDIDRRLTAAGRAVQSREAANPGVDRGVAVGEFPLATGFADYMLFVDRRPIGVVEAKPAGTTLSGVEAQAARYSVGLPPLITTGLWPAQIEAVQNLERSNFQYGELFERGGWIAARRLFGAELPVLLEALNQVLVV